MSAIHPTMQAALRGIAPPTDEQKRFSVKLVFADGVYIGFVWAYTEARAFALAISDARMASPYSTFRGKLLHKEAVPA